MCSIPVPCAIRPLPRQVLIWCPPSDVPHQRTQGDTQQSTSYRTMIALARRRSGRCCLALPGETPTARSFASLLSRVPISHPQDHATSATAVSSRKFSSTSADSSSGTSSSREKVSARASSPRPPSPPRTPAWAAKRTRLPPNSTTGGRSIGRCARERILWCVCCRLLSS